MVLGSSNTKNASSGNQNPSTHEGDHLCVNMVKSHINVATRSRNYNYSQVVPSIESPPPLETPLQIENLEPLPRILK